MQLVFRPEAQRELIEARSWYEERSSGLGLEFARAADAAIERILQMPFAFPQIEADFRQVRMSKSPYSIIYLPTETELLVVSCFHHRRNPGLWRNNLSH